MALKIPRNMSAIGAVGRLSETKLAKDLGAKLKFASGAVPGFKGDMETDKFLIEAKSTVNGSMSLKHEWLAKISREARLDDKLPALAVSFTKGDGNPFPSGQWVCIPLNVFKEMCLRDEENG